MAFLGLNGVATNGMRFLRLAILARLLDKEAFGVFALVTVMLRALEMLTDVGPQRYLIQKTDASEDEMHATWVISAGRGLLLAAAMYVVSPFYASAVDADGFVQVFQLAALTSIGVGLINPRRYMAERELRYGGVAAYETASAALDVIVTIALAWWLRDVRALVGGMVVAAPASAVLSYFVFDLPGRPRFQLGAVKEMLSVGRWFVVISVGTFIMSQGDNLLVGKVLGAEALGVYVLAYRLASLPVPLYGKITNRVALPLFSRIQHDPRGGGGSSASGSTPNSCCWPASPGPLWLCRHRWWWGSTARTGSRPRRCCRRWCW